MVSWRTIPAENTPRRLKAQTIRFDRQAFEMVRRSARELDIPVSQFVREAACARALLLQADSAGTSSAEFKQRLAELANVQGAYDQDGQ